MLDYIRLLVVVVYVFLARRGWCPCMLVRRIDRVLAWCYRLVVGSCARAASWACRSLDGLVVAGDGVCGPDCQGCKDEVA